MSTRRTKKEMEALDARIRPLYERNIGCRIIGQVLDENPVTILKRVRRMGIARSSDEADKAPSVEVPFSQRSVPTNLAQAAVGVAVQWFLHRGYMVSIPVEPTRYDLVVESDVGLQRVQVKTTTYRNGTSGAWLVKVHRQAYDSDAAPNANGKRTRTAYSADDIDSFFIVTGGGDVYIIPIQATGGAKTLCLDSKYASYRTA